jgi:hypothetical protein
LVVATTFLSFAVKGRFALQLPLLANAPKKITVTVFEQKHVHCVTRASNFFPQAVLHN